MVFFVSKIEDEVIEALDSAHLISCRIKPGDEIIITNLQGLLLEIKITKFNKKLKIFEYQPLSKKEVSKPESRILIQSQIDKLYLEKLVEILPFSKITELKIICTKNSPKQKINFERLDKILIRSCEQSHTFWKPKMTFENKSLEETVKKYQPILLEKSGKIAKSKTISQKAVLVGPEGGFSHQEMDLFNFFELEKVSLGEIVYPAWIAAYAFLR